MKQRTVALDARLMCGQSTGDSTYWTGLIHGLSRIELDFRFLLFSNAPQPENIPKSELFEWIDVPGGSRLWSLVRFPLAARRLGADAIHTQYSLSPLVRRRGITTVHDVSFFVGPQWFRPKDRFLLRASVPASAARAARVITVSETSRQEIEAHIPDAKGKTRVTPLAAGLDVVPQNRSEAKALVRAELGVNEPFMLTVGTRWPRKNMSLAVEAAELLSESLPHKLIVTGKQGWGQESTSKRVIESGFVTSQMLSALYSAADLYLAPSYHEGFGIPLIEAFKCGCPVLCSGGGALPETAGDAARIESSWAPGPWAATIESLLNDSSNLASMRERGFARAKRFTWEETARKTLEVYREVAN